MHLLINPINMSSQMHKPQRYGWVIAGVLFLVVILGAYAMLWTRVAAQLYVGGGVGVHLCDLVRLCVIYVCVDISTGNSG